MRRIGIRHLDNRRTLTPRQYARKPWTFGTTAAVMELPEGGDEVSLRIAIYHHQLVIAVHARNVRVSDVCARFGFGRDVWHEVLGGHRWPGETVYVALVDALAHGQQQLSR